MKYLFLIFPFLSIGATLYAQCTDEFEILIQVKSTPLNDQQSSGTCWSFATTSFIESEALRLGHDTVSISPIYYVHPTYLSKAEKFIETKGKSYFGAGDLSFSVMDAYKNYGAVPESVYDGIIAEDWQHDHLEMDNLLYAMVASIGTSGYGRIKPMSWKKSIEAVLNSYLSRPPATFLYNNKIFTPQSFAQEHIGIKHEDYLEVTSYSHSSFYKMFVLDIPANWNKNKYLNIPIKDFEKLIDHALESGYSLAWDGDATEPYFSFDSGILKLPDEEENITITQEWRQKSFEDKSTTDDHNMHIIGKAKDANQKLYYIMKNSEGTNNLGGYIYMTKNALLLKTISVLVHKDAIPPSVNHNSF